MTSIERTGAAGEVVRIHLSDGSFFLLHAQIVAHAGIVEGTRVDGEEQARLCARSEAVLARVRALSLLARSAQTRRGLARKLAARGFSPPAIRHALARMTELGYLDDRAFAASWLASRMATRKEGAKALTRGLLNRGVPRAVAEEMVEEACPFERELETALRVADGLGPNAAVGALARRGFRSRTIATVLRRLRGTVRGGEEE